MLDDHSIAFQLACSRSVSLPLQGQSNKSFNAGPVDAPLSLHDARSVDVRPVNAATIELTCYWDEDLRHGGRKDPLVSDIQAPVDARPVDAPPSPQNYGLPSQG